MPIPVNGGFEIRWPSVADIRFGPHASLAAAKTAVPLSRRAIGLMVMVAGVIYWWKEGTADNQLVAYASPSLVKEYAAVLSQTGTAVPTAAVVNNSLPAAIVWTRNSAGSYTGTLAGGFTPGKTFIPGMNQAMHVADRSFYVYSPSADTVSILVRKISDGSFTDIGQVDALPIHILVYP